MTPTKMAHVGDGVYLRWLPNGAFEIAVNHHENVVAYLEPEVAERLAKDLSPRLTPEELEAIEAGILACEDITYGGPSDSEAAATLRNLHARSKPRDADP